MSKRARGIVAASMLVIGLVALQVAISFKPRAAQVATLPDGSTLRLEAVGYGKEHIRPGVWWHPFARRLPPNWQRKLNVQTGATMSTTEPSLGVWLVWDQPGPIVRGWFELGLVDEHGVEAPASTSSSQKFTGRGQPDALGYAFTTLPRRGNTMTLRLYQRASNGKRELVGSFELGNPARSKFPEWRPQPLPAVVRHGDLEIQFRRLVVGVGSGSSLAAPKPGEEAWARVDLEVKKYGVPTDVWFADGIELEDATGNKTRQNSWSGGVEGGTAYLRWQPYLWASEAAWKIRVEFIRHHEKAVFSTNELIAVTGLALPAVDDVTELNLSTNRLGHTIRVFGLANGKGEFAGRNSRMGGNEVKIEVDVSPDLGHGKRMRMLNVRDDLGRKVDSRGWGRSNSSYSFGYKPKPDAKSLDFTLVVQEVVTAEFLVKPELFKPAPTPK